MWHAARAQYSRQLRYDSRIPKIMQQKAFSQLRNQTSSDSTRIDTVPNLKADRNGLWSTMLPLSEIHSRVMHLNYVLCNQSEDSCELPDRVEGIAEELLDWHHRLPQHLRYLPANIARYKEYKLTHLIPLPVPATLLPIPAKRHQSRHSSNNSNSTRP
jgi:hypothetical protein